jgi:hypothetical protein
MHKLHKNEETTFFKTHDLGLATALCCRNYELLSLDKQDPRKVSFVFKREVGIEEDADAYWSNELETKARNYFDNLRTLKNRIYSE